MSRKIDCTATKVEKQHTFLGSNWTNAGQICGDYNGTGTIGPIETGAPGGADVGDKCSGCGRNRWHGDINVLRLPFDAGADGDEIEAGHVTFEIHADDADGAGGEG